MVSSRNQFPHGTIDLQTIIKARWIGGESQHAPNGTDELLAWILILIDMVEKQKQEIKSLELANGSLIDENAWLKDTVYSDSK